MKEKNVKMYLKECMSKLEVWNYNNLIKLHNKIKSRQMKRIYNFFLRIFININFCLKMFRGKLEIEMLKDESLFCIIPINIDKIKDTSGNKFTKYLYKKCINNIERAVNIYNVKIIILSKKLKELEEIRNICTHNNVKILDGKYLLKVMLGNVLEYIVHARNEKLETQNIHIVINQNSEINIDLIEYICGKVKSVKIVTKQIRHFRKIRNILV